MWRITKGNKILNVVIYKDDKILSVKNFYEGEILPIGYAPPKDYINQKIVERLEDEKTFKRGIR
jgi:hypothetical protein